MLDKARAGESSSHTYSITSAHLQFHAKCNVQPITTTRETEQQKPEETSRASCNVGSTPAMSTAASRERHQGGGGVRHQFPVGRRRYVPVVDAGCGCRPRRPSLLRLPSFLKSGSCHLGGGNAVVRRSGVGEQYSSSSTSTASFSSSSCAATHSTFSSSSDYYYHAYGGGAAAAAATKQQHQPAEAKKKKNKEVVGKKKKMAAAAEEQDDDGDVGVAVEKESCDPRADFRESMVQMVVEMGLCDWDGLRCMLRRLLALNAPRHHAAILTAFAEVCAQIIAAPAAALSPLRSPKPGYHQQYRRP